MKKNILMIIALCMMIMAHAQRPDGYLSNDNRPRGIYWLPQPPSLTSGSFGNDFYHYQWGKEQRAEKGEQALWDESAALRDVFSEAMGVKLDSETTPEIMLLVERAVVDAYAANSDAKKYYQRRRPFATFNEPSLKPSTDEKESKTLSYPSGHSSRGWMYAMVLSTVAPERTEDLMARARQYAENRVICGHHWKSDIDASLMLTAGVFTNIVVTDAFQHQLAKAREEYQRIMATQPRRSIVILYENDVHCAIDGYTRIAGLRDAINRADTAWAAAVCVGDFLQGNTVGAMSHGQYIIDIMRHVGYDALTLGNHEFDYGIPRMKNLLTQLRGDDKSPLTGIVTCANFFDTDALSSYYAPFVIRRYGMKRVAFVGVLTPETMVAERYAFFDDNGVKIGDLRPDDFYKIVQKAVDRARSAGADYVVLLSHVGEQTQSMGFDSHQLVAKTKGIDIVLDGHTHSVIPSELVANADGEVINVTQTGTQFANIGKLVISPDGRITTELLPISSIPYENAAVTAATDSIKKITERITSKVVAQVDFDLVAEDAQGQWLVRNTETNLGNLVADAYRQCMGADIAFENGGGLRNGIAAGSITFGDVIGVLPYDNTLCAISATGQQIINMLKQCTAITPLDDGNFPQCSGIRYKIHTGSHKVSHVEVLQANNTWAPIKLKQTYSVALTTYNYNRGGFNSAFDKCPLIAERTERCYEVFNLFLRDTLGGKIPQEYAKAQGRILIVND